jgi:hypothetical protein
VGPPLRLNYELITLVCQPRFLRIRDRAEPPELGSLTGAPMDVGGVRSRTRCIGVSQLVAALGAAVRDRAHALTLPALVLGRIGTEHAPPGVSKPPVRRSGGDQKTSMHFPVLPESNAAKTSAASSIADL